MKETTHTPLERARETLQRASEYLVSLQDPETQNIIIWMKELCHTA